MLFLNTLLCKQGFDSRLRFLIIHLIATVSFLLINSATDHKTLSLIVLLTSAYFSTMSALRRLKDADLKINWLSFAVGCYLLTGLAIIFINIKVIDLLILIPLALAALLLTYPSKNKNSEPRKYHWGYNGPIDLSHDKNSNIHTQQVKIEPSFTYSEQADLAIKIPVHNISSAQDLLEQNAFNHSPANINAVQDPKQANKNTKPSRDIGEMIRHKLLKYKKLIVLLVTIAVSLLIVFNISKTDVVEQAAQLNNNNVTQQATLLNVERLEQLDMPDNFTLFFNQYGGLIINWQADEPSAKQTWSLINAKGDDSCQQISFNKGEKFRTLTVTVENNLNHYANFSPLDTQKLLQAIAFRGNFTLCDFKFSLKGSQAALNKNNKYAEQINY